MEVNDLMFKNGMRCVMKFCYHLDKSTVETVKLMKESYKHKCFGEPINFRWHDDFKKGNCLWNRLLFLAC